MNFRQINQKDYKKLLELDKKVYPTDAPVTPDILNSWYQNNPEFGIIFEADNQTKGMCIAIPLNESGWNKLINGELAESELDSSTIFKSGRDKSIGIHIYHVEKLDTTIDDFYKDSLRGLSSVINNLKKNDPDLKIAGLSGLCVTSAGIGLFYNKFNCRERNFMCSEHILSKNNKLIIVKSPTMQTLNDYIRQDYAFINRCKMLIVYPNEPSIVWSYLDDGKGLDIV